MIRSTIKVHNAVVMLGSLLVLAACSGGGIEEDREWMKDVQRTTHVAVPKLAEPKNFVPFSYEAQGSLDPFDATKLKLALAKDKSDSKSSIRPDTNHERGVLEGFPLDTIQMVGVLQKKGRTEAIVKVDNAVFTVKVGDYLGQDYGKITGITDSAIDIKEIVKDASDEWVERKTTLELQESKK